MRIDALFGGERPTLSFEFFPPQKTAGAEALFQTIHQLQALQPDFISITRTGGGTEPTLELTLRIQQELGIRAMSHLTCLHHSQPEMEAHLETLWQGGVRNVLALRGDPENGQLVFKAPKNGFAYANELTAFVAQRHDFCIGVAGYPEGHPQCLNLTRDIETLKAKLDAGGRFIITQLFFDNADFLRWRERCRASGITVPIVAGIMPIENVAQIKRFVTRCGAKIPQELLLKLEAVEGNPDEVYNVGIGHAIAQCQELLREGVDYTLNKSKATAQIGEALTR
ncbi:methylenetetrahydrofolate reductase [NAD(P)H] [Armatimonas rosea]|uniref:Methylenetetrahydrofolate reductase n=1 Tax=Armatimonas rosea TaxID=685828 RepID=A0A7W9W8Y3_ARMRO|nr:methylenetetrahydrofolate reductase [NAD(P)H] [Armatimonas rosea]MBB6052067.1 methylenetetrahydrofolate reductase (NADPH) [Armatimonas rosea]